MENIVIPFTEKENIVMSSYREGKHFKVVF